MSAGGRLTVSDGTPWEPLVGYARAVRVGPHVWVSGTTGTRHGRVVAEGDVHAQTRQALANVADALARCGAGMEHVVRTRLFVTDIGRWEEVGRAHAEAFGDVRPVATMVEVARLIDPAMLVEIEADAYVPEPVGEGGLAAPRE